MEINYNPNLDLLKKYLKPAPIPFFIPDKELNLSKKFDETMFKSIQNVANEKGLPVELISDFYWIVTEFIQSYSNHEKYQKDAEWNRKRNTDLSKVLSFYDEAVSNRQSVTISANVGQKSASIDDPISVSFLIDHLRELKGRFDDESMKLPDFKNEAFVVGAPAISNYLMDGMGIQNKRERAKIIAYLFSIAGFAFRGTVSGKKIPLPHTHNDWDEESAKDTVLNYLKKSAIK